MISRFKSICNKNDNKKSQRWKGEVEEEGKKNGICPLEDLRKSLRAVTQNEILEEWSIGLSSYKRFR